MRNVFHYIVRMFIFVFAFSIYEYTFCRGVTKPKKQKEKASIINNSDDTFAEHLSKMDIPDKFKLSEIIIGSPKAAIELIIYFSYTCPHCRVFHQNEFPKFKKKFVDTGKVKIVFRNYIDDQGALEAAQIVRCLCGCSVEKYIQLSELVLANQVDWLQSSDPPEFLKKIFKKANFSLDQISKCLKRSDIGAGLMIEQKRAMHKYGLSSMPAFIIGEQIWIGSVTCEELEEFYGLN